MPHDLTQTISLLTRTPATFNALLRDLPDSWTQQNEGPNTWTPYAIVSHLVHTERSNWLLRAKIILEFGEIKTFEPLDREATANASEQKSLPQLLHEFATLRAKNLAELLALNLQPQDLARRGRHPAFGPVTFSQLMATWATHDLTHLHQLSRVLAHQYREAVGPWSVYLGVLKCDAHSSAA
jgi:DinB superfamily